MSKTKLDTGNGYQVICHSSTPNQPSIAKIKIKMLTGITKNEPKYIVVDKKHVVYK